MMNWYNSKNIFVIFFFLFWNFAYGPLKTTSLGELYPRVKMSLFLRQKYEVYISLTFIISIKQKADRSYAKVLTHDTIGLSGGLSDLRTSSTTDRFTNNETAQPWGALYPRLLLISTWRYLKNKQ